MIRPSPEVSRARVQELLMGLEQMGSRATFAVCGHLMLDACSGHPDHPDGSLLEFDPKSDISSDPGWYARDLVERILEGGHEIACHSFSHISFQDPRCTEDVARYEIVKSRMIARELEVEMATFVFPRHEEAYHDLLVESGFSRYITDQSVGNRGTEVPRMKFGMLRVPRQIYLSRTGLFEMAKVGMKTLIYGRSGFLHAWLHDWNLAEPGVNGKVLGMLRQAKRLGYEVLTVSELGASPDT
jgi:peptidoglycan/xylan/chitin deacetylase (PgdA/CDA1 family)